MFTLAILVASCKAQDRHAGLAGELAAAEVVDNSDDLDVSVAPEMSPIEHDMGRDTETSSIEDLEEEEEEEQEEEELELRSILTPSVAFAEGDEAKKDEVDVGADPAKLTGVAPTPFSATTSGSVDTDLESAAGAAVFADATDAAGAAGGPQGGHVAAAGEESDSDDGPVHATSGPEGVGAETAAAEGSASKVAADTPTEPVSTWNEEGKGKGQGENSNRDTEDAAENETGDQSAGGEATEERAKLARAEGEGTIVTSGDSFVDDYNEKHEVPGSGAAELDAPAAVAAAAAAAAGGGMGDEIPESASSAAGGDASAYAAPDVAAASTAEIEAQEKQLRTSLPPSTSEDGATLGAEASADAATDAAAAAAAAATATAARANEATATTTSATAVSNVIPGQSDISSTSGGDGDGGNGGGAVGDDAVSIPSSSSVAGSPAPAAMGPQAPARPGEPSSSTATSVSAAGYDDDRPLHVEGSHDGGGRIDGDITEDHDSASTRVHSDQKKIGRRSGGVEGNDEAGASNRDRSGGRNSSNSGGWNEAGGHERHRGSVEKGEGGEVGTGGGGAGRGDEGDGRGDGDARGGIGGDAEFPRGSAEELAQLVRDMEAELMRKVLAEEDAKSLLDM